MWCRMLIVLKGNDRSCRWGCGTTLLRPLKRGDSLPPNTTSLRVAGKRPICDLWHSAASSKSLFYTVNITQINASRCLKPKIANAKPLLRDSIDICTPKKQIRAPRLKYITPPKALSFSAGYYITPQRTGVFFCKEIAYLKNIKIPALEI